MYEKGFHSVQRHKQETKPLHTTAAAILLLAFAAKLEPKFRKPLRKERKLSRPGMILILVQFKVEIKCKYVS